MESISQKSLKLNAFFNVIKTITSLIFPLITFPYASRILLAEGIGKVNFSFSIISYFSIIANLGIGTYGIREAAKIRENKILLSKFVYEVLILNLISTFIAYLLLMFSFFLIPKFHEYKPLLLISSSNLLLTTIGISWLYQAVEEYGYITIRTVIFQIVSIVLLFLFVKDKNDYIIYACINVISTVGANIFNIIHAKKYLVFKEIPRLEFRKHLKPIFILFASTIAISIFTILDTSMLGFLSSQKEIGYYSAASKIIRMIRDLFPAVFTVLFARLSLYQDTNQQNKIIDLSSKTFLFIFCFVFPITFGLYILIPDIVVLMCGNDFTNAIQSARIMVPLLLLSSSSGYLGGQLMISLKMDKTYLFCMIGAAITDIIFNLIFIPSLGAYGASLATLLTELLIFITYFIILRKIVIQIFHNIYKETIIFFASSIIMGLLVFFISMLFNNRIIKLIFSTICGIICYSLLLYILRSKFFLQILNLIKNKIIKKGLL